MIFQANAKPSEVSEKAIRKRIPANSKTFPTSNEIPTRGATKTKSVVALVVVLVTARLLGSKKVMVAVEDAEPTGLSRILFNKWYVDEFYHRWVVDPILTTSRVLWRVVDARIIDGTVIFVANLARAIGWVGSLVHTGQVNTYAFFLTVGVLVILAMIGLQG